MYFRIYFALISVEAAYIAASSRPAFGICISTHTVHHVHGRVEPIQSTPLYTAKTGVEPKLRMPNYDLQCKKLGYRREGAVTRARRHSGEINIIQVQGRARTACAIHLPKSF